MFSDQRSYRQKAFWTPADTEPRAVMSLKNLSLKKEVLKAIACLEDYTTTANADSGTCHPTRMFRWKTRKCSFFYRGGRCPPWAASVGEEDTASVGVQWYTMSNTSGNWCKAQSAKCGALTRRRCTRTRTSPTTVRPSFSLAPPPHRSRLKADALPA